MMASSEKLILLDALHIETSVFSDNRGESEIGWEVKDAIFESLDFAPNSMLHTYNTAANTLRGLHYQISPLQQKKLVSCVGGSIWDVVADIRPASPSFGLWQGVHLTAKSGKSVFVPKGCAHGYVSLEAGSVVSYLIEGDYEPTATRVLRWDDPFIAIKWPVRNMTMSDKDAAAPGLDECEY